MGLTEQLRTIVDRTLQYNGYLGNIPVTVTYYSGTEGGLATYNPVTQTMTRVEATGVSVTGVWSEPEERLINNVDVLRSDRFFYVADAELLRRGVDTNRLRTAKPQDRIARDGVTYTIVKALTDAVTAHWELQLRRP